MNLRPSFRQPSRWSLALVLVFALSCTLLLHSDEWKARHALVSHTGVMNLDMPPAPAEVFLAGPSDPAESASWLAGVQAWRADRRSRVRYGTSVYDSPDLAWSQRIFSQVQLLLWDRSIYDPEKHEYTVAKFLSETEHRLGPIDAVLLWHVYPNLGLDERNQLDLLRDLPGGLPALKNVVDEFHRHNVKVFFPVLVWDTGTRASDTPLPTELTQILKDLGADGINFDTLESPPATFRAASLEAAHPLALEPQFEIRDDSIGWSTLGWNDWVTWEDVPYPFTPMISQSRWVEPRHMVNVTDRFTRDKTDSLQHAFFNGEGYAILENLWGFWYGMTPHDAEAVLRFTRIERAFPENLISQDWQPHTPTVQPGVFASKFPAASRTLWTIVNRNEFDVDGEQLRVPYHRGLRYFDVWHGVELTPQIRQEAPGSSRNEEATLSFSIEGLGFGAILATEDASTANLQPLLAFMAERSKQPLRAYPKTWASVPQTMVEIPATKPAATPPAGMLEIPSGDFNFAVRGIEVEGGNDPGVDVQFPWEPIARRAHNHLLHMHRFFLDRTLVTNAEFKQFLDAAHYRPADDHNFLRDWKNGTYPDGWENKPVTWVSLEDARAYAAWAGKRLPHDWEWQYAAQGTDGRVYPWGNELDDKAIPPTDRARTRHALTDVAAFPKGASTFGILDLEGSVSQWTDEFRDEHTRAAIVRGGAAYHPAGSIWYFPQTYRLDEHQKLLLMSPGHDRAGTIGFRCVVDAQ